MFNLEIRLNKVKQLAFFQVSPHRCPCVEQLAAVSGFYFVLNVCIAGSHDNLLFSDVREKVLSSYRQVQHEGNSRQVHDFACSFLSLHGHSGEVQLCTNSKG